jgi:hypothetical protein
MKIKISLKHAFAAAAGSYFFDRSALAGTVPVMSAPLFSQPAPVADAVAAGATEPGWVTEALQSGDAYRGTEIDPNCVNPNSRANYVFKKVLANRPLFDAASTTTLKGSGVDGDSPSSPLRGDSLQSKFVVPPHFLQTFVMTSGFANNLLSQPNDGAQVAVTFMPSVMAVAQKPDAAAVSVFRNAETTDYWTKDYDGSDKTSLKVGLGYVVSDWSGMTDEPDGTSQDMSSNRSPWTDVSGGVCVTYLYLNQFKPGKGMRRKKTDRGIEEKIEGRGFEDLGRSLIDWLNETYDSKSGVYATGMGLVAEGAVHLDDVENAAKREQQVCRFGAANATLADLAYRTLGLLLLTMRYDTSVATVQDDTTSLSSILWDTQADAAVSEGLKHVLARGPIAHGGASSSSDSGLLPLLFLSRTIGISGDWTALGQDSDKHDAIAGYIAKAVGSQAFVDSTSPSAFILPELSDGAQLAVVPFYGTDRRVDGDWTAAPRSPEILSGYSFGADGEVKQAHTGNLFACGSTDTIQHGLYSNSGLKLVSDPEAVASAYSAASRLVVGASLNYKTTAMQAFFEDGIPEDTADWGGYTNTTPMVWWCRTAEGDNR